MKNKDKVVLEIMSVKDRIERVLKEHREFLKEGGNRNIICTSLELAEITGKEHKHVLEDIEDVFNELNRKDVLKFRLVNENPSENPLETSKENFRIFKDYYVDPKGQRRPVYYLDEVMYLCMLNKYNNYIRYNMALYYVGVTNMTGYTLEELTDMKPVDVNTVEMLVWTKVLSEGKMKITSKEENNVITLFVNRNPSINEIEYAKSDLEFLRQPTFLGKKSEFSKNMLEFLIDGLFDKLDENKYNELCRELDNEDYYSTSRIVASATNKEHFNVRNDVRSIIRDLETKGISIEELSEHFVPYEYLDNYNRKQPEYLLSKVGFITLLGRYFIEVNYRLAEFYVETKHYIVEYEKAVLTEFDTLFKFLENKGKVIINKEELINEGDVKNDK